MASSSEWQVIGLGVRADSNAGEQNEVPYSGPKSFVSPALRRSWTMAR